MKINYDFESRLQVRSNCCISYDKYTGRPSMASTLKRRLNLQVQREKAYSGKVTKGAAKRITKAVNLLVMFAPRRMVFNEFVGKEVEHKLSFITLTVSDNTQNYTAKEAYEKLLKPMLRYLVRNCGMSTYIWKAELQKRGQIHYHITTPSFISYVQIRKEWNRLQRISGMLDSFYDRYGHCDPNSTDIHKVFKLDDITSYLIKYLAKAESEKDSTKGKVWDCSLNLKQAKYPDFVMDAEQFEFIEALQSSNYLTIKVIDRISILSVKGHEGKELLTKSNLQSLTSINPLKVLNAG